MVRGKGLLKYKSVIITWIVSYVAVFLVPLFGGVVLYSKARTVVEEQIMAGNYQALVQIVGEVDGSFFNAINTALSLEFEPSVTNYSFSQNKQLAINSIIKSIRNINLTEYRNDFVYIYLHNEDFVVTQDGLCSSKVFYDEYVDKDISLDEWRQHHIANKAQNFTDIKFKFSDSTYSNAMLYKKNIPYTLMGDSKMTVGCLINVEKIKEKFQKLSYIKNGNIYVLNSDDKLVFQFGNGNFDIPEGIFNGKEVQEIRDEKNVAVLNVNSSKTDWQYIVISPKIDFMKKANDVFLILLSIFILVIAISVFLIYVFVKKNYLPVRSLLSTFNIESNMLQDEFTLIKSNIAKIIDDKVKITKLLENRQNVVQKTMLLKLLSGDINYALPVAEVLESDNIVFLSEEFIVIMFCIEDYGELFKVDETSNGRESHELAHLVFTNILEELINETHKCYAITQKDEIICIISLKDENNIHSIAEYSQKFISSNFDIQSTAIISDINSGFDGIAMAYDEVTEAVEYRSLLTNQQVIHYADVKKIISTISEVNTLSLIDKIKAYVDENYSNAELTILTIGEEFNLTGAYASTLFKRSSGIKLLDYINYIRIQKSKELLTETLLTIGEIAPQCGINNKVTFMRLFKKYEGTTPGKYRDDNKKN